MLTQQLHDEQGDEVQVHFVDDEVILSFSDEFCIRLDWQIGDDLSLREEDGKLTIVNKSTLTRLK